MERLRLADERHLCSFVRELYHLDTQRNYSKRVIQGVERLIGGNSVAMISIKRKGDPANLLAGNVGPEIRKLFPIPASYLRDHPCYRHHLENPEGRAVSIGDLLPLYRWRNMASYNETFAKVGLHEQFGARVPLANGDYLALVIGRSRRTFTERDHVVMNVLRHHVSAGLRSLTSPPAISANTMAEALEPFIDGFIVALDAAGSVQFFSEQARKYFEVFFMEERPFKDGIPDTVRSWIRSEISIFGTSALAIRPPKAFVVRRGEKVLNIQIAQTRDSAAHVLVLRVEDAFLEMQKLVPIGLGLRRTGVLYWLAKGKTNEEIGIILGMATGTVKTHLKHIFSRLGVENRTSAASVLVELMSRP
jgi:hypothetical protein